MRYEVVVVQDVELPETAWMFVCSGVGDVYLCVTRSAMQHHPERVLTRAWQTWEQSRDKGLVAV